MLLQRHAVLPFHSPAALPHLTCPSPPHLPFPTSPALPYLTCPSPPHLPHQVCNLHVATAAKALSVLAGSETMSKRLREGEAEAVLSSIQDSSSGPLCSLQVCFAMHCAAVCATLLTRL